MTSYWVIKRCWTFRDIRISRRVCESESFIGDEGRCDGTTVGEFLETVEGASDFVCTALEEFALNRIWRRTGP